MFCNEELHDYLKEDNQPMCYFCNQGLKTKVHTKREYECCDNPDIDSIHSRNICMSCGTIHGDIFLPEFINIYENIYKIRKKSIYHRRYHIEAVLFSLRHRYNIDLSYYHYDQIYRIFNEIEKILPLLNNNRKRMISIKFMIKQLLMLLGIPCNDINITTSKRTLKYYVSYWDQIMDLIGDDIKAILQR